MVQGLRARVPAQAGVWGKAPDAEEAEWAGRLQQGRVEVVSVQTAEKRSLMLQDSLVMQKAVQNVVQK